MQVHAASSAHTSWTSAGLPPRSRITTASRRRAHGGRAYAKAAVGGPVAGTAQAGIAARLGRLVLKSLAAHWFAPLQPTGGAVYRPDSVPCVSKCRGFTRLLVATLVTSSPAGNP
jgi:hypothetical protein